QADQPFERTGKTPPRLVECVDAGEPVLLARVHASEEHAVLEHRVDADDRAVELHLAAASVDAEQADDTASPEKAERVGHQLRVAGRLDDEVEAAEIGELDTLGRHVVPADSVDDLVRLLERGNAHVD